LYTFRNVAPGTYQLTVALTGFASATRADIVVAQPAVDVPPIALGVATLGETVIVSASKTESALIDAPATVTVVTSSSNQPRDDCLRELSFQRKPTVLDDPNPYSGR